MKTQIECKPPPIYRYYIVCKYVCKNTTEAHWLLTARSCVRGLGEVFGYFPIDIESVKGKKKGKKKNSEKGILRVSLQKHVAL